MKNLIYFALLTITSLVQMKNAEAQETPFNCTAAAYLFQANDVYAMDLASGSSKLVARDITPGNVNATGYNPVDGFIYGFLSSPSGTIVRIGDNFQVRTFEVSGFPTGNNYVGDISSDGIYYLKAGGSVYHKVNLNNNTDGYGQYLGAFDLSQSINVHDWAFNAADNQLYTVEKGSNVLYRINPENGVVTALGVAPEMEGLNYTFGATYFDVDGNFYASSNQTGTIYMIPEVQTLSRGSTMPAVTFAYGPSSSLNDGARCPTAPVAQENCSNGIDDDGDGLVDCKDPACTGVEFCDPTAKSISSGNDGGLESNDRLSQQINQRNFLREKNNYTFNPKNAKLYSRKVQRMEKSGEIALANLIPDSALVGATPIVSSASDLIQITNATDILSVDYRKNDETVAVVLATKTENGVYEHTKYICDRLLGAELLSVSTIEIKGTEFIKSIIKNADGTTEFVLSFSVKMVNGGSNFEVESHWNIDKYEAESNYYNFQIWTNNIDDLLTLSEATLNLIDGQFAIVAYNNSTPPPVFVKKGKYNKGKLELDVVNNNGSDSVVFTAGMKRTETTEMEFVAANMTLDPEYISKMEIETGDLFAIGFRLEAGGDQTPDDLFLSDGPWGMHAEPEGTTVLGYEVTENESQVASEGFQVERGVKMQVATSTYAAIYRAFTPRFKAVNLNAFNTIEFDAYGEGSVEVTIIKKGIETWEEQYKATVVLTADKQHFYIPFEHFTSPNGKLTDLSDAISLVFTVSSDGQEVQNKEVNMNNVSFTHKSLTEANGTLATEKMVVAPNPVDDFANIQFTSTEEEDCTIQFVDIAGRVVQSVQTQMESGNNEIGFAKADLKSGVYMVNVISETQKFDAVRIVVR